MPELPDLIVFADNLNRRLAGQKVVALDTHSNRRLNIATEELDVALRQQVLEKVERSGKEMAFIFARGTRLLVHLMLAGRFVLTEQPERLGERMLTLHFADGPALVVTDPKGLVRIALNSPPGAAPDALAVDATYLREAAAARPKTLIKTLLIDQAVVGGIGNAYADEILWAARISPKAAAGNIPGERMAELAVAIGQVLTEAVEKIRAVSPDITGGEVRDFLLIHNPRRAQSPTGYPIVKEKVASKTTYFTEEQVLY